MMLSNRYGDDLVECGNESLARGGAIDQVIFFAVGNPDIHHRRSTELDAEVFADAAAGEAMIDPELAHLFIRMAERGLFAQGMGEAGGIEIEAKIVGLGPLDPTLEVLGLKLVPRYRRG